VSGRESIRIRLVVAFHRLYERCGTWSALFSKSILPRETSESGTFSVAEVSSRAVETPNQRLIAAQIAFKSIHT
jgi:hypothetical protein